MDKKVYRYAVEGDTSVRESSVSMDERVYRCAVEGDTSVLLELVREDELILERLLVDCEDTPLHVAALRGHVNLAKLLLQLMPGFAKILDLKARSPLHLVSARDHAEIAREILGVDAGLCLLKDQDGRNPLHIAAIKGFIQVSAEILAANPRCMQEVTSRGETVLHLSVRNNRLELLRYFLDREDVGSLVDERDDLGDTVFDLASKGNNSEIMKALSSYQNVLEVGSSILLVDSTPRRTENMDTRYSDVSSKKMVKQFDGHNDNKLSEKRGAMMVVSVLIATLTYQAALNPPGGFWQDDKFALPDKGTVPAPSNFYCLVAIGRQGHDPHCAGTAVNGDKSDLMKTFVLANAVGLFASLIIISLLTSAFTIRRETMMWVLMIIMWVSVFCVALSFAVGLQMIMDWSYITCVFAFLVSSMGLFALLLISHVVICLRKLFR